MRDGRRGDPQLLGILPSRLMKVAARDPRLTLLRSLGVSSKLAPASYLGVLAYVAFPRYNDTENTHTLWKGGSRRRTGREGWEEIP